MVMRDIGSFHWPKPRFISRGGARHREKKRVFAAIRRAYMCRFIQYPLAIRRMAAD